MEDPRLLERRGTTSRLAQRDRRGILGQPWAGRKGRSVTYNLKAHPPALSLSDAWVARINSQSQASPASTGLSGPLIRHLLTPLVRDISAVVADEFEFALKDAGENAMVQASSRPLGRSGHA